MPTIDDLSKQIITMIIAMITVVVLIYVFIYVYDLCNTLSRGRVGKVVSTFSRGNPLCAQIIAAIETTSVPALE